MDRAPIRPAPRVRDPALDPGADRPRPARDRRRGLGEADVGRAEPRPRRISPSTATRPGTARRGIRSSWSAPSRCCGCSPACASTRSCACGSARSAGRPHPTVPGDGSRVCLLDVPTNKTTGRVHQAGRPDRRRRDRSVAGRPAAAAQVPGSQDRRAGRHAARLPRRAGSAQSTSTGCSIPLLCRKAGVPREDVRGQITSHRARATIATQLYNAKDPMSLFELQAWLGHSNAAARPSTTRGSPRSR